MAGAEQLAAEPLVVRGERVQHLFLIEVVADVRRLVAGALQTTIRLWSREDKPYEQTVVPSANALPGTTSGPEERPDAVAAIETRLRKC